jgi:putative spermidine/putrescine transport system ATP-binding protein
MTQHPASTSTATTALDIAHVVKRFGDSVALDDVSLAIREGEFISFLGPSGCGKTTLLRVIAGFEQADEGSVRVDGQDVGGIPAHKRNMGVVFQSYSLFPNMTAAQNVGFGLQMRGLRKSEVASKTQHMLELVGLTHRAAAYPNEMSGGQQQRVALARALAIEPRILLLDEPLSALDAKIRVSLRDEIRLIQKELGITTIFVTHDQEEALTLSDRIAVFSVGRVEQFGTPQEIYESPQTSFVASFVGEGNRFRGRVAAGGVEVFGVRMPADVSGFAAGADVQVVIRPEDTRLHPDPAATGALAGTVVTQQFHGGMTRIVAALDVQTSSGDSVLEAEHVIADYASDAVAQLTPGTRVALTVAASAPLVTALA